MLINYAYIVLLAQCVRIVAVFLQKVLEEMSTNHQITIILDATYLNTG
jgi:hypothetical protein